jgi:ubiquinone biosynthesis protein COQ9
MVSRDAVVDAALALADAGHWESVRLHEVAARLGVPLDDIREHFSEKEQIVDAWMDRADQSMLRVTESAEFARLEGRERIQRLILTWLDTLAPYRRVTREMVVVRLEPGHLHHQIPSVMRISRTVQWVREAAGRKQAFLWRALEETALTTVFVTTFIYWLNDDSPGQVDTRKRLRMLLDTAGELGRVLGQEL